MVIFSALFFVISAQLNVNLKAHVDELRKTLRDIEDSSESGELAAVVSRHASLAQSHEDIYLLTDKAGKYIAGNIRASERFEGWRTISWSDLPLFEEWAVPRKSTAIVGIWTPVNNGYLFVGDGNGDINEAQQLLFNGLIWATGLSMVSAIVAGYILGLKAQRRVEAMRNALDAVASGQLKERIPISSSSNDIDHVAGLINATLDRLERLIDNLKQVWTDIAHDLRTPIGRMRQKLELLQTRSADLSTYKISVDETVEQIDAITETFNALLRISEIEAGARQTKFVDVELNGLLANIIDALEAVAEEHGHRITASIDSLPVLTVPGDRRLLNQLFTNVVENSIVHCPSGSEIRVELDSDGGRPTVRIRDNGPGIPVEEHERVFRRLYRLEKSRSTRGNGLGLSLVGAIAELHGAAISLADNSPGLVTEIAFQRHRNP